MEVQVDVAVEMPGSYPGLQHCFNLGPQFPVDLRQQVGLKKVPPAHLDRIIAEAALSIHQMRNFWGRQNGPALDQGEMHAQTEVGKVPGQPHGC